MALEMKRISAFTDLDRRIRTDRTDRADHRSMVPVPGGRRDHRPGRPGHPIRAGRHIHGGRADPGDGADSKWSLQEHMIQGSIRKIHFVGIGGTGMCGLAEILLNLGYDVCGSDLSAQTEAVDRLVRSGARVFEGHDGANVAGADLVVISSAIRSDNPEFTEATRLGIPILKRGQMLAEIMRLKYGVAVAGAHGKTTTTSLVGHVLSFAGLDPTLVVGGRLRS
jgi:Mur ligase-like protein